jgi:iron complex outermembrane receptor protein
VTFGEYGLVKWQAGGGVPIGRGGAQISLARTTTDGFRQHSTAEITQFSGRLVQPIGNRSRLTLSARVNDSPELLNPGALTAAQFADDPSQADPRNVAAGAGKAVDQWQASVAAGHRLAGGGELDAAVFGLGRKLDNPLAFRYIALDREAWGGRATATLPVHLGSTEVRMSAGLDAQWQRDDRREESTDRTEVLLDQQERVRELGPFLQASLPLRDKATLTAGLRYDRVAFRADDRLLADGDDSGERIMDAVSWSAGVSYALAPGLAPYASISTSFETPTTTELANRPDGAGGFNPDLEPQRAINYELGLRGIVGARMRYAVAGYVSDVRDELIPFEVPGAPNERFFRNAGSSWHRGIELEATIVPASQLAVVAAYAYTAHAFREYRVSAAGVTDTLDGNELPGVPRHYAHLGLRYDGPAGLWGGLDVTHSSSYYVDDGNDARNDAWTATGVRVGWEGQLAGWRVAPFAGVLNLFSARYAASVVVNARGGRYYEPAPPRNVYMGMAIGAAR